MESTSSTGSGDRLKRSSSLLTRIQSMDVDKDAKRGKQPIVRRLLTSPKKVSSKSRLHSRAQPDLAVYLTINLL